MLKALNPSVFRSTTGEPVTHANVDRLLDAGQIEVAMKNGNWWKIRRNGKTQKWKTDPERIRIPFKYGFRGTSAIVTEDFSQEWA